MSFPLTTQDNACAVHQGMCSTPGDVQYTGGCSIHWGISLSTPGDVQYTWGISLSTPGVFSTVEDTMSTVGGYHDECGDIMRTARGVQYTGRIP